MSTTTPESCSAQSDRSIEYQKEECVCVWVGRGGKFDLDNQYLCMMGQE